MLQRKWSLVTLCLIVCIGVGCYIAMACVYRDLSGSQKGYYQNYRFADFIVDLKRAPEWVVEEVVSFCGTASGRDHDKFKEKNLTSLPGKKVKCPVIKECSVFYECRVVHKNLVIPGELFPGIRSEFYPQGDYHTLYFGQILAAYKK